MSMNVSKKIHIKKLLTTGKTYNTLGKIINYNDFNSSSNQTCSMLKNIKCLYILKASISEAAINTVIRGS